MVADNDNPHFSRLTQAVEHSYSRQSHARSIHHTLISNLMAEFYPVADGMNGIPTSINLMSLASRAMIRATMSKAPRVMLHTTDPRSKAWIEDTEIAVNQRIVASNFDDVMYEVARQSMISFGILYMGADYVGDLGGMRMDLVRTAVDRCNYVYDIDSTSLEDADFQGHKFLMKVVDIHEHPLFNLNRFDVQGDIGDSDQLSRTNFIAGINNTQQGLYDYAEVWCIYDKPRNSIFYYPKNQPNLLLAEVPWTGPEHGPYLYLYYEKPPNHAVPISPMMHLLRKHQAYNVIDGKAISQQEVAKSLLLYTNAAKEEAERIVNAVDNQSALQENGSVRWVPIGGTNATMMGMAAQQKADLSYAAGGMDTYAGLSGQGAETATESSLLNRAASQFLEDMQGFAEKFVKGVCEDLVFYVLADPDKHEQMLWKKEKHTGDSYSVKWTPEKRTKVRQLQFQIDVEPYSYRSRSPEQRLGQVLSAVELYMKLGPAAAAQGVSLDVVELFELIGKRQSLSELNDILVSDKSPEELQPFMGQGGGQGDMGQPRVHERHSTSDGSGEKQAMLQAIGRGGEQQEVVAA